MKSMTAHTRIEALAQLLRAIDELKSPLSAGQTAEPSEDLRRLLGGEISSEDYFSARIEASVTRISQYLDRDEANYVRLACHKYLGERLMKSGLFARLHARLREGQQLSNIQKEGQAMNQNKNAAKEEANDLGSEDLQQFKRGEITMDEYMERRLQNQIKELNLDRFLTNAELEKLRKIMRENFLNSPLFEHYVEVSAKKSRENP